VSTRGWIAIAAAMVVGFAVGMLVSPPLGGVRAAIASGRPRSSACGSNGTGGARDDHARSDADASASPRIAPHPYPGGDPT
jgi:hypothetical protein